MPEIDGVEFFGRTRALEQARGGNIAVIALTAFSDLEDRTRAPDAGFLAHASKPVKPSELVTPVASIGRRTGEQHS